MAFRFMHRSSATVLAATIAAALTGCATGGNFGVSTGSGVAASIGLVKRSNMSGTVHGGQQPVTGSVVTLWAAGTSSGYGKGATAIASTLSDAQGNFSLNPATVTNITGYASAGGVVTFTTSSAGSYAVGQTVILGGFPVSTFFNGQEVVVAASTPTSFTTTFGSATLAATSESGTSTYYNSAVSSCTIGQFNYITAVGGNPGLPGAYGTVSQPGIALMAALPTPCVPATTGATTVFVDEITTAAAVTALQQFMTINTSGTEPTLATQSTPPWTIGAPTTNTIGLANAFAGTVNLVNISTGTTGTTSVPSTVGGNAYTVSVAPDAAKLNTFADVLSTCFTGSTANCNALIADTTPTTTPTTPAPIDAIQVAYYMATQPAGLNMNAHGYAAAPYWQCVNYVTATAPFLPTEACSSTVTTPTFSDWTVGVKWTLKNSASANLILSPTSIAIDASGHIWLGSGSGYQTVSPINEFSVSGQYLLTGPASVNIPSTTLNFYEAGSDFQIPFAGQTGVALTYGRQDGLAIDTTGNVFFVQNSPTVTPSTVAVTSPSALTFLSGMVVEIPSATATAGTSNSGVGIYSSFSNALAIAGNNDIFISDEPVSSRYYTSTFLASGGYTTLNEGGGRSTSLYQGEAVDANGYGVGFSAAVACATQGLPRNNAAGNAALPLTPPGTAPAITLTNQCANYGAFDNLNNLWVTGGTTSTGTNAGLAYVDLQSGPGTPIITSVPGGSSATAPGIGGVYNPAGIAVDGAGNIWVANGTSGSSGLSEFTSSVVSVGSGSDTLNAVSGTTVLSPSSVGGFEQSYTFGTVKGTAIDPSGNLWLKISGTTVAFIVGAAAPIQTPLAAQLAKTPGTPGSIGVRP